MFGFGRRKEKKYKGRANLPLGQPGRPVMQDIIPPKKFTLADRRRQIKPLPAKSNQHKKRRRFNLSSLFAKLPKLRFGDWRLRQITFSQFRVIVLAVLALALIVFGLNALAYVKVLVIPKQEFVDFNKLFDASKTGNADLVLEIISLEDSAQQEKPTTGLKDVKNKAHGTIVIYNAYSSSPQILVKNTRFETPNGKIYRIPDRITVPGANVIEGEIKPSSIEAEVFADEPGEDYNIGLTDFTIPGFKGSKKYEKFYARSKTIMDGGFVGIASVVLREDIDEAKTSLREELEKKLKAQMEESVPKELFMPDDGMHILVREQEVSAGAGEVADRLSVKMKGVLEGVIMSRDNLKAAIVESYYGTGMSEKIELANFDDLNIRAEEIDFEKGEAKLVVQGKAHFVWSFDRQKLSAELASADRKNRLSVFKDYSAIERAEIIFVPSWWPLFPSESDDIRIETILKTP